MWEEKTKKKLEQEHAQQPKTPTIIKKNLYQMQFRNKRWPNNIGPEKCSVFFGCFLTAEIVAQQTKRNGFKTNIIKMSDKNFV